MSANQIARMTILRDEWNAKRPPFDRVMSLVLDAWNTLDSCRGIGMDVGAIPYTAILAWCDRRKYLDDELTDMIADAINHLDAERMRTRAAKREAEKRRKGNR